MIVCDLLRGALVFSLMFVPPASLGVALYVVSFTVALVTIVFNPSRNRLIRGVVPPEDLGKALGLLRSAESTALILGPAFGSVLLLLFSPATGLIFNAVSYAIGAVALMLMRVSPDPLPVAAASPQGLRRELLDGLRFTVRAPTLLGLIGLSSVLALVGNLWFTFDLFFIQRSLRAPPESVGLLWTAAGLGGLLGGVTMVVLKRQPRTMLLAGLALRGGSLILYALSSSLGWAGVWAFVAGFGEALTLVALQSAVLSGSPQPLLGRVTALLDTGNQSASLLALGLVGLLSGLFAPWQVLFSCGVLLCSLALGAATWEGLTERQSNS